jgi:hypothetical protein
MEHFEHYLRQKRIDSVSFRDKLPEEWSRWKSDFESAGALAFDHSKKFLLNPIRIQFPILPTS